MFNVILFNDAFDLEDDVEKFESFNIYIELHFEFLAIKAF